MEGTDGHIQIRNRATSGFLAAVEVNLKLDYGWHRVFTETDTREFSPVAQALPSSLGEEHTWEFDDKDGFFQLKNIRFSEYLYAAEDDLTSDEASSSVFTGNNEEALGPEGLWKFSKDVKGCLYFYYSGSHLMWSLWVRREHW